MFWAKLTCATEKFAVAKKLWDALLPAVLTFPPFWDVRTKETGSSFRDVMHHVHHGGLFVNLSFEDVNTIVGFSENVGGRFRFILELWLTWACNLRVYNGEEKSGLLLRRGCWKFSLWYVCSLLIRFLARLLHFEWIYFALFYISTCFEGAFPSVSAITYWNYVFPLWQNHLYL